MWYRKISPEELNTSVRDEVCRGPDRNIQPESEIFLFHMDGLMMGFFSPIARRNFSFQNIVVILLPKANFLRLKKYNHYYKGLIKFGLY